MHEDFAEYFGELNEKNELHGRGIKIYFDGIDIGYFDKGEYAPGNYIVIGPDGEFDVGKFYTDAGGLLKCNRTQYNTNGTSLLIEF